MQRGRKPVLKPHQVRAAIALRRSGASVKAISARLGLHRTSVWRIMRRYPSLCRSRNAVMVLLEDSRGAQRLDLARLILDLEELAKTPEPERTVSKFERIRGAEFHRNTFARMRQWCERVGIRIEKIAEPEPGEPPRIVLDAKAVRLLITPAVADRAEAIRTAWERRQKKG